jgi:outer membrane protein assembly factor BamB
MLTRIVLLVAVFGVICSRPGGAEEASVLTYHGDSSRSGNFVVPSLTWEKARSLHLDQTFDDRVAGHLYAQPLYWRMPGSDAAMVLVVTEDNIVQAFDAQSGKELWRRRVGTPIPRSSLGCGNINPLGITGTPVIDPSRAAIYFDAAIEDATGPHHRVFGLSLSDGSILKGWPVDVGDALRTQGDTFHSRDQDQRSALTILDGMLYVPFGGHFGDCGDYRGRVVGVPLHDPTQIVSWQTRGRGGGIWAPGGLSVVGSELFFATGNTLDVTTWSDGEAVFRVPTDLHWVDDKRNYFAPSEWK